MLHQSEIIEFLIKDSAQKVWVLDRDCSTVFMSNSLQQILRKEEKRQAIESLLTYVGANDKTALEVKKFIQFEVAGDNLEFELLISGELIALKNTEEEKITGREDYISLFEYTPVPIWDEDLSLVKQEIDQIKLQGISDIRAYFEANPDEISRLAEKLIVNDVNQAVVDLNEAETKEYLMENFWRLIDKKSAEYAVLQFEAIARGDLECEFDAELRSFAGNIRYVRFKWKVVKGHEKDYSKVFLITTDLTQRIIEENVSLQNSIREKEVLLKEVHHRVKNNLQIISSLLNLQARTIDDPVVRETFDITLTRIHSMATVHELLYKSKDISHINIKDYVQRLVYSLFSSMQGDVPLKIDMDIHNIVLHINTAIPLGLMINEILTNSLIHGITENKNPEIYVKLSIYGDFYQLNIGDNGKGLRDSDFDGDSLGLQLILSLVEQLNGRLKLLKDKPGTHYEIRFEEIKSNR